MPDPTTTNRGYAVPTHGSDVDTWDAPLNANFALIDNNLGGLVTIPLAATTLTLSAAQYKCGTIRFTGVLANNVLVTFPAVQAWWVIDNQTTGNFAVRLTTSGSSAIAIPPGVATDVYCDGTFLNFRNLDRIGSYWDYAGSGLPVWVTACTVPPYLLCDGTTFSAVTYPFLNTILGGNTLPDLRGRSRFALNSGTGRITTAVSGIDGDTRFSAGGAQSVTIGQVNLPNVNFNVDIPAGQGSHTHTATSDTKSSTSGVVGAGGNNVLTASPATITIAAATLPGMTGTAASGGSGTALASMPPACISGLMLIRAG